MIQKISQYFNGVQVEMKKVTWLSKEEMFGSTMIVGVFAVLIAIFLFVVDFGFKAAICYFHYGGNKMWNCKM